MPCLTQNIEIKIEDIKDTGLTLNLVKEKDWLNTLVGHQEAQDFSFPTPVAIAATITKSGRNILVRGKIKTRVTLPCARCLESFEHSIDTDMDVTFMPTSKDANEEPIQVEGVSPDLEFYKDDADTIDISKIVRDQILLAIPFKALCEESCKGLCPQCGTNLNKISCGCDKSIFNLKFEVLRKLTK